MRICIYVELINSLCIKIISLLSKVHNYNNILRTTRAAETGRYRLIEEMFATKGSLTGDDLAQHDANNLTLDDLYTELKHEKEDLISRWGLFILDGVRLFQIWL